MLNSWQDKCAVWFEDETDKAFEGLGLTTGME